MNAEENVPGADEGAAAPGPEIDQLAAAQPPTKKETSLREFLGKMDEYAPIVCCVVPVVVVSVSCGSW